VAAYRYLTLNQQLDRTVRLYAENETELFTSSMLSWSTLTGFVGKNIAEDVTQFNKNSFSPGSAKHTLFIPPDMKAEIDSQINQLQNHVREMNGERSVETDTNYIQGTFSRNKALSNDYLHFFAPGDPIFDSIVQNALYSYKGRSAAFVMPASFNWEGLIFTWQLNPNEAILLENGIDIRMLNPYRGYLPGQQLMNVIPANETFTAESNDVIKELRKYGKNGVSRIRREVEHLGGRSPKSPILGIKEKYGCSDLEWFQRVHPRDKWTYFIQESYKQAKSSAWEALKKMARIKELKADLLGSITSQKAAMAYFAQDDSLQETERINKLLLDAFLNSKVELDSVCYVRMVKSL
jgi:ATP-dependent helicase HepA